MEAPEPVEPVVAHVVAFMAAQLQAIVAYKGLDALTPNTLEKALANARAAEALVRQG